MHWLKKKIGFQNKNNKQVLIEKQIQQWVAEFSRAKREFQNNARVNTDFYLMDLSLKKKNKITSANKQYRTMQDRVYSSRLTRYLFLFVLGTINT